MKLALLLSGGKDSIFSAYLAKKKRYKIVCAISIVSKNKFSYMYHTPSITSTRKQAEVMQIPFIEQKTAGEKEDELNDLKKVLVKAKKKFNIDGIITGAIESVYQASRIEKLCNELKLKTFNPLWHKDQLELLKELIKNKFEVIITAVGAEGFDKSWLGRKINNKFIRDIKALKEKYRINPAGEGGEYESFVLNCPLFSRRLNIKDKKISGSGNSCQIEISVE